MFLWGAALGHVGSAYRHTMIGRVFAVVKGGFGTLSSVSVDWIFRQLKVPYRERRGAGRSLNSQGGRRLSTITEDNLLGIRRRMQDGGDSRLRGNDGMGGREWGNAKAQGRNEKQAGRTRFISDGRL